MDKKRPSSLDKKLFLKIHRKKATSFLMASFLNLRNPCIVDDAHATCSYKVTGFFSKPNTSYKDLFGILSFLSIWCRYRKDFIPILKDLKNTQEHRF